MITATQAAIWHYANGEKLQYASTAGSSWTEQLHDMNVNIEEDGNGKPVNTESNINLFYEFLINQSYHAPEDIVLTDNYFVKNLQKIETPNGNAYDLELYFQLEGTVDTSDDLTFTATVGEQTQTMIIGGKDGVKADRNGYYSVVFKDVSSEDLQTDVAMSIQGTQNVSGVYFYQAKPEGDTDERDTSQNLVGRYDGVTNVTAEKSFKIDEIDEYYMSGSLNVTKKVLLHDVPYENNKTYYVTLFEDEAMTKAIETKALSMNGTAESTVTYSNLTIGETYYVAETDAAGNVIEAENVGASRIILSESVITIPQPKDKQAPSVDVTITNCYDSDEYFYEGTEEEEDLYTEDEEATEESTEETSAESTQTGDDMNMGLYGALMLIAFVGMAAATIKRRHN